MSSEVKLKKYTKHQGRYYYPLQEPLYQTHDQVRMISTRPNSTLSSNPTGDGWISSLESEPLNTWVKQLEPKLLEALLQLAPEDYPSQEVPNPIQACLLLKRSSNKPKSIGILKRAWASSLYFHIIDVHFQNPQALGMCQPLKDQPRRFKVTLKLEGIWIEPYRLGARLSLHQITPSS